MRIASADAVGELAPRGLAQAAVIASVVAALIAVAVWWSVAYLIFQRSRDRLGLPLAISFFCFRPCLTDPTELTALARSDPWPFVAPILMLANAVTIPWVFVFPDGKPVPRWSVVVAVVWSGWYIVRVFVPAADPHGLALIPWAAMVLFAVGTVVWRYLRVSDRVQRRQIKWVLSAGVAFIVFHQSIALLPDLFPGLTAGVNGFFYQTVTFGLYALAQMALPIALVIAVVFDRLFDVDVVIRRTLVYVLVTATIAAVFFGGIVALELLLHPLTSNSELAVALSTLLSTALFLPIRRNVQRGVDLRFNRSHYDAERIVDRFGARLRDEVNLDAVRADLLDAVHDTMAPAALSLWLRERPG
jgi:hypothetical protein